MKKQNGITLIALVISIIVMLILAGVSINAIVGENGVLRKAQYSSFMNEMAAVEEAVQLWKAGELIETKGEATTAIPANGLCKVNDLTATERLVGEIGYYRTWSIGDTMPDMSILSSAEDFNKKYEGEFIFYPAGVQDLYYLNNEALDLDEDKVYLIDASTSIVYSMTGISINGVRCYSSHMAKAVMGNNVAPLFAEAEVSGGGDNIAYAGATYLKDKNGNYIDENGNIVGEEDKVLNPNGFQIIANSESNNIYKLYNNGELYAKGVKGWAINTSEEEMQEVDRYKFIEWSVEEKIPEIGSYKEVIQGVNTIYIIDIDGYLWALGDNSYNKLGLTEEQQIEHTGRDPIKLNVDGKSVKKVFPHNNITYVITEDNYLYVAGCNLYGAACVGNSNILTKFTAVNLSQDIVEKISRIYTSPSTSYPYSIIRVGNDENQSFYFAGSFNWGQIGLGERSANGYSTLTKIWDGNVGEDFDQDIVEIATCNSAAITLLKRDGTLWHCGYRNYDGGAGGASLGSLNTTYVFEEFAPNVFGCSTREEVNIKELYETSGILVVRENAEGIKEYWGAGNSSSYLGLEVEILTSKYEKIPFPSEMFSDGDQIKEVYPCSSNVYYIMTSGKVWASGSISGLGKGMNDKETETKIICITKTEDNNMSLPLINTAYKFNKEYNVTRNTAGTILFEGIDGKYYNTGSSDIMYRNNILQMSWTKMNPIENGEEVLVKSFKEGVLIDQNNNLWVAGTDSRYLGLGETSARSVNNYEKVTDVNIAGKVKDASKGSCTLAVLTTDKNLYVVGDFENKLLYGTYCYPGWSSSEGSSYSFKEITSLSNIEQIEWISVSRMIVTNENDVKKMYAWGRCFVWNPYSTVPKEVTTVDASSIQKIICHNGPASFVINNDGKLYAAGYRSQYVGMTATSTLTEHPYFSEMKVKDIVQINNETKIVLTEDGDLYGWGTLNRLGINSTSTENSTEPQKLPISNVESVVGGSNFIIAIKDDGTVWGTGTNQYGILGRWIGIDRSSPNSRYKTAFEWVECPELEI